MTQTPLTWMLLGLAVVVAGVGGVEAARQGDPDLAVLFGALVVIGLVQVARTLLGRPPVGLRADLVRWARERSQLTGEPVERVLDRAVATARASLAGPEGDDLPGAP